MAILRPCLRLLRHAIAALALAGTAQAADYPAPREGDWIARDFRFTSGEVMPELKLHYTTIGNPDGEPVLVLHGTAGSGATMLTPAFAGELFGPGQPLDAARHYIILPDAIGTGKSAKPSDGLRTRFPRYGYEDMVKAQYRLVTEGLGLKHLRLVIGNSMGGMHTWLWGVNHPDFMDALVPMAAQPTEMSGRNWMLRRMLTESIRRDPDWNGGQYTTQPRGLNLANQFFALATNGGNQALYKAAPTREQADRIVDERLAAPFKADANDVLYQWEASRDYNPAPGLARIRAALLAINAADDERNPPELGIMERELQRVRNGSLLLIPASADTRGHGTTALARFWKDRFAQFLQATPRLAR
ncbi:Homoserine O-acetyltransferase [Rubrivivax sp. A210]|uniref:alpha/beta fold hydrolase n=1 Tax=Rubrivivax sp. A210 TaxID=2772301 RepID=UPI00191919C3|nr:alpha/beta fold hydrolase [Rubrivivax sp. A210]CAD5374942.1 Homoserine O-acetyltransferase [Rubrivivax sp. A210]